MTRLDGHALIVLVFVTILIWHAGRAAFPEGNPPAFVVEDTPEIYVWLGEGLGVRGVRQISDEANLRDVIELTDVPASMFIRSGFSPQVPVLSGQRYYVEQNEDGSKVLRGCFLSAARRMALGISLHPDRMNHDDWLELKGIGPVLAERIEAYRQKNGDFGSLERLQSVKGIGPKRIAAWTRFF